MLDTQNRPEFFTCHNGDKAPLPFSQAEYAGRLARLRKVMADRDIPAVLLTSMHNIAYYTPASCIAASAGPMPAS